MVSAKISALLTIVAVVTVASSAIAKSSHDPIAQNTLHDKKNEFTKSEPGFTDHEDDDGVMDDKNADIDGNSLKYMTEKELQALLEEKDKVIISELDIIQANVVKNPKNDHDPTVRSNNINVTYHGGRQKRWIGALLGIGRLILRGAIRAPRVSVSGLRITQQYFKRGNYQTALRDFRAASPRNVKSFSKNGISGQTGTVGNYRFTVRDGSSGGRPTLEIRAPKPNGGEYVRKIRYD